MVDPVEPTEEALAGSASESAGATHNTHTLQYIAWGITILGILLEFMKSRHEAVKNGEKPLPFDLEKILDWAHAQRKQPLGPRPATVHKSSRHRLLTIGLGLAAVVISLLLATNEIIKLILWLPAALLRLVVHIHKTVRLAAQDAKAELAANAARVAAQGSPAAAQQAARPAQPAGQQTAAPAQASAATPASQPQAAGHGNDGHASGTKWGAFFKGIGGLIIKALGCMALVVIVFYLIQYAVRSSASQQPTVSSPSTQATATTTAKTQPTTPDNTPTPQAAPTTPNTMPTSSAIQANGCPANSDCRMLARVPAYHNDSQYTDWEDVDLEGKTAHMNMTDIRARCRANGSDWSYVSDVAECHSELQVISMRAGGTEDIRDLSYYLN